MIPRIDTRMYSNLILTIIAVVLVAMAAQQMGINVLGSAQAQRKNISDDLNRTATGVAIDTTIPQTQDVAVAQATSEVAVSNREIATAIRELAAAVRESSSDIKTVMSRNAAAGTAGAPAAGAPAAAASTRPTIEVR